MGLCRTSPIGLLADPNSTLSFYNLEVRDRYFSRLKSTIEFNLANNEKKTVLVSHSMGGPLLLVRATSPLPVGIEHR